MKFVLILIYSLCDAECGCRDTEVKLAPYSSHATCTTDARKAGQTGAKAICLRID